MEGFDDLDKVASFCTGASPRRSTSSLGGMQSSKHLIFRSPLFSIEPGEDAETNPGIYGKALANWLASRLPAAGRTIHGCLSEDFGRLVHVAHPRLRVYVACANGHEFADEWQIFAIAAGAGLTSLFASREKKGRGGRSYEGRGKYSSCGTRCEQYSRRWRT
jgi:hypothetical protein